MPIIKRARKLSKRRTHRGSCGRSSGHKKQLVCVGHVIMCLCIALNLESLSHKILVSEFSYKTVVSFASLASMRQGILTVSFTVRSRHCWQMLSSFPHRGKVAS